MAQRIAPRSHPPTPPPGGPRWPAPGGNGFDEAAQATGAPTLAVGLWFFLVAVTMLFVAFSVSFTARRTAPDWQPVALPAVLWLNTVVLVASSAVVEWARHGGHSGNGKALRLGLGVGAALGGAFLLGQVVAWRDLAAAGVFMRTHPHSAFFYLLTGVHGLHLLGGLGALGFARRRVARAPLGSETVLLTAVATYWHFLTALWLYVFILLRA